MILGYGIDIAEIERLKHVHQRFGMNFLRKILAENELVAMPENIFPWLAGRFAAKEAASKALGYGFSRGISPLDFMIFQNDSGKPELKLMKKAGEYARNLGIRHTLLSISHERNYAIAGVILED